MTKLIDLKFFAFDYYLDIKRVGVKPILPLSLAKVKKNSFTLFSAHFQKCYWKITFDRMKLEKNTKEFFIALFALFFQLKLCIQLFHTFSKVC